MPSGSLGKGLGLVRGLAGLAAGWPGEGHRPEPQGGVGATGQGGSRGGQPAELEVRAPASRLGMQS